MHMAAALTVPLKLFSYFPSLNLWVACEILERLMNLCPCILCPECYSPRCARTTVWWWLWWFLGRKNKAKPIHLCSATASLMSVLVSCCCSDSLAVVAAVQHIFLPPLFAEFILAFSFQLINHKRTEQCEPLWLKAVSLDELKASHAVHDCLQY